MTRLSVTLIQLDLIWENAAQNRSNCTQKIRSVENTDVIVLPEMFTTGFSMFPEKLAEEMSGVTIAWMKALAKEKNAAICGSLIIKEHNKFYNRFLFVRPTGDLVHYDKRHLFSLAGEHKSYIQGREKVIVDYKGWKICPMVCYDLRFPAWSRYNSDYDILIYVANWPKPRIKAWDTLLQARAIENMSYTLGVNRIGRDGNGHEYTGNSKALDCLGNDLTSIPVNEEKIATIVLNKKDQEQLRKKFNFLNDRDQFKINASL